MLKLEKGDIIEYENRYLESYFYIILEKITELDSVKCMRIEIPEHRRFVHVNMKPVVQTGIFYLLSYSYEAHILEKNKISIV
jgi:hypothetical protein